MKKLNAKLLEVNLKSIMERTVDSQQMLGAICQVNQNGEQVVHISVGKARLGSKEPVKDNDIFRLASMSKNICGVTILQMIDRGKLSFDTPIDTFFPGFADKWIGKKDSNQGVVADKKAQTPITIRHLVTHTSGIASSNTIGIPSMPSELPADRMQTLASIVEYYEKDSLLVFEPGSCWSYSPLGECDILSHVVELLSDMPYDEYVRKFITDPLEMPDTVLIPNKEQWNRMVTVLSKDEDGNYVDDPTSSGRTLFDTPLTHFAGGGSFVSTLPDYMKLSEAIRCDGTGMNGYQILTKNVAKLMGTPLTPQGMPGMFFPNMMFGVLVNISKDSRTRPDGCYGWGGAYGTLTWIDPVNKLNVVYMRNSRLHASVFDSSTGDFLFEKIICDSYE